MALLGPQSAARDVIARTGILPSVHANGMHVESPGCSEERAHGHVPVGKQRVVICQLLALQPKFSKSNRPHRPA
jgi:hypothetical protein